jgi:APA family basic amino acid/polyamine antiporter
MAGARAYYAMAKDRLFFPRAGTLNAASVPGHSLWMQGAWAAALVLPRTFDSATGAYGNLYSNLLDYVISSALIFYILTIAAVFRLRAKRPEAIRLYRVPGYPVIPALYILGAALVLVILFAYRPASTWPGLIIVLAGGVLYAALPKPGRADGSRTE